MEGRGVNGEIGWPSPIFSSGGGEPILSYPRLIKKSGEKSTILFI
jgi:hypothetical protein